MLPSYGGCSCASQPQIHHMSPLLKLLRSQKFRFRIRVKHPVDQNETMAVRYLVLLLLLELIGSNGVVKNQTDIILLVGNRDSLHTNLSDSLLEDSPAIIYLVKTSFPEDAATSPTGSARVTRGMSHSMTGEDEEEEALTKQPRVTLIELVLASMRKPKDTNHPPMSLVPPAEDEVEEGVLEESGDPENVGGSLGASTAKDLPHLPYLFTDLASFLMQPLRPMKKPKDASKQEMDRDGRYESSMVATMPHRRCPPGLKQDPVGNCRPMFRNRRGYNLRRIRIRPSAKEKDTIQTHDNA